MSEILICDYCGEVISEKDRYYNVSADFMAMSSIDEYNVDHDYHVGCYLEHVHPYLVRTEDGE